MATRFTAAGFAVKVFGEWHAKNHPDVPIVQNVGFMVDDEVFYPGDALTVPRGRGAHPAGARRTRPG